jgi:hypothetical protein
MLVGVALGARQGWARWAAIVLVAFNIVAQFGFLAAFPLWTIVLIGRDVMILYTLTARWQEAKVRGWGLTGSSFKTPAGAERRRETRTIPRVTPPRAGLERQILDGSAAQAGVMPPPPPFWAARMANDAIASTTPQAIAYTPMSQMMATTPLPGSTRA